MLFSATSRRDLTRRIAGLESDLRSANMELYFYQVSEWYCSRFLPASPFKTLVWVLAIVIVAVAAKGIFEFWQESLVGRVVNSSLYDLRNRPPRHNEPERATVAKARIEHRVSRRLFFL